MRTADATRIWEEPHRGGYPGLALLALPGLEQLRTFLDGRSPPPPIHHLTGMTAAEQEPDVSVFTMPATGWLVAPPGLVHPGALPVLADGPLGSIVQAGLPPMTPYTTAELSMNYVAPVLADGGTLTARGRLILARRSLGLSEAMIEDAAGRPVAHATSRCVIFPPLGEPPPEPPALEAWDPGDHETPDPYLRPVAGEPVPQEAWASMSGLDVLRAQIAGELPAPPMAHLTGLWPTGAAEGEATFVLPATHWICSPLGRVEGGMIAMLAETVLDCAVGTTLGPGSSYAPLDLKVNFLRPVQPDGRRLTATGRVVHRGRTMAVATADVTDANGKRVAVATGTSMLFPGRPWTSLIRPAEDPAEPPASRP